MNWWMELPRDELQAVFKATPLHLDSGCILWQGSKRPTGYGLTRVRGRTVSAHRVACFLRHGKPAGKQDACHTCDNPSCVAPSHLFWGSRSENMLDASAKRRLWQHKRPGDVLAGHRHPNARLTDEALREIVLTDAPAPALARKHGYDVNNIRAIRKGKLWKAAASRIRALALPTSPSKGG